MTTKQKGKLSKRLAAQKPAKAPVRKAPVKTALKAATKKVSNYAEAPATATMAATFEARKGVKTKFVVREKHVVPNVDGYVRGPVHKVHLSAAYEPHSIQHGQATVQGNADNQVFGHSQPEAAIVLSIPVAAFADQFVPGEAVEVTFTPIG